MTFEERLDNAIENARGGYTYIMRRILYPVLKKYINNGVFTLDIRAYCTDAQSGDRREGWVCAVRKIWEYAESVNAEMKQEEKLKCPLCGVIISVVSIGTARHGQFQFCDATGGCKGVYDTHQEIWYTPKS